MRSNIDVGWEQISKSGGNYTVHIGNAHDISQLLFLFEEKIIEAIKKKDHQKNPSFIVTMMKNSIQMLNVNTKEVSNSLYSGHVSRVGKPLKKRGKVQNVCWSLVKAVIEGLILKYIPLHFLQPEDEVLATRIEGNFYLWILEEKISVHNIDSCSFISVRDIDTIMIIIEAVAKVGINLADRGYRTSDFETRCHHARETLKFVVSSRAKESAISNFKLPKISLAFQKGGCDSEIDWHDLNVVPPAPLRLKNMSSSLALARTRAINNLGAHPSMFGENAAPSSISCWMSKVLSKSKSNSEGQQLVIKTIELWLMKILNSREYFDKMTAEQTQSFLSELETLLDEYRTLCNDFMTSKSASGNLKAELRSRELLSTWIVFCITHSAAKKLHPMIEDYDVALQWSDLRHLYLGSSVATAAVLAVAAYLKQYSGRGGIIFSLQDQRNTLIFGRCFSTEDPAIQVVWAKEKIEAANREANHWTEVKKKQNLAKELRLEVIKINSTLAHLSSTKQTQQSERDARKVADAIYGTKYPNDLKDKMLQSKIQSTQDKITAENGNLTRTKSSLVTAETPPRLLSQPLPREFPEAMTVLFFLHMPSALGILSRLSVVAQQTLIPRSFDFCEGNTGDRN
jgi:hypothetical protein